MPTGTPRSTAGGAMQTVGFVGLGNMGSHMAAKLLTAGFPLVVHDRNEAAMRALEEKGAARATSAAELAEGSDAVVTMLPSSAHVAEVYWGPAGLLTGPGPLRPSLLIDASTVDPDTCQRLARRVATCRTRGPEGPAGARAHPLLLDAPVSGGVVGAKEGTLTFMVGGEPEAVAAARPILAAMGTRVVHCGPCGSGSAAKLCNNLALAVQMAGVAEALALGQRLGLHPRLLSQIFNSSTARSWSSEVYNPVPGVMEGVPSSRAYAGGFSNSLMAKDLGLAVAASEACGAATPLGSHVLSLYKQMCDGGAPQKDFSSIYELIYGGQPAPVPET